MTDQRPSAADTSSEAVIHEALSVIDGALAKMIQREIVSSGEVADLLLDVRSVLADAGATQGAADEVAAAGPVGSDLG